MIIEAMMIGGAISILVAQQRSQTSQPTALKNISANTAQQHSLTVQHQEKSTVEEKKIDQNLKVLGVSLALVSIGSLMTLPIVSLLGVGLYLYSTAPLILTDLYTALVKERRVNMALLEFTLISLMLVTQHFFAATLGGFLYVFSKKLVLKTENHSRQELTDIFGQQQTMAWLKMGDSEIQTAINTLQAGDIVIVNAGENIPVDGVITAGIAGIDQHILTGEAHPVDKEMGDSVFASTVVLTGRIEIIVEKAGQATVAAQIGKILLNTADFKMSMHSRGEQIADQTALPTLAVGGVAMLAGYPTIRVASLMNANFGYNMRVLAPISMLQHLSFASKQAILIKDGRALELLEKVDTVIFDKTGTLTEEQPTIGQIHTYSQYTATELLQYAASAEQKQTHPIAQAIMQAAREQELELLPIDDASYHIGYGLSVHINGQKIQLGSRRFFELEGIAMPPSLQIEFAQCEPVSLVMIAMDGKLAGIFEMQVTIRPEVPEVMQRLREHGIQSIYIISGDNEAPTRRLAEQLNLDGYYSNVLPEDKASIIKNIQASGQSVCYIGDGINDSIALKQAHVSVSLSGASAIATDTAAILLMDGNLTKLPVLFGLSKHFSSTLTRSLMTTLVPGVISISGVLFLNFGMVATILINQVGLAAGMANTLLSLRKDSKLLN